MIKNALMILAVSTLLFSCENKEKKDVAKTNDIVETLTVDELLINIDSLVDKNIEVTGLVSHVCKHGGKRLVLVAENPEKNIHVNAGEEITEFNKNIEGNTIKAIGVVKELKITNEYLDNMIAEMKEHKDADGEEGVREEDNDHHSTEMEKINKLREEIKNSKNGYLSEYSILCNSYKTVEVEANKTETDSL